MEIGSLIADSAKENEGVWIDFDADKGVAFKIAYIGKKQYDDKLNRIATAVRRRNRARFLPASIQTAVTVDALNGTILLDWRGLTNNGESFPFNEENAKKLLTESKEIRDFVQVEASLLENFQDKATAAETDTGEGGANADLKSGAPVVTQGRE